MDKIKVRDEIAQAVQEIRETEDATIRERNLAAIEALLRYVPRKVLV